jgi:hypothetical protein
MDHPRRSFTVGWPFYLFAIVIFLAEAQVADADTITNAAIMVFSDANPTVPGVAPPGISDTLAVSFNFCDLIAGAGGGDSPTSCILSLQPGQLWTTQRAVRLGEGNNQVSDVYVRFNDPMTATAKVALCSDDNAGILNQACFSLVPTGVPIEDIFGMQGLPEFLNDQALLMTPGLPLPIPTQITVWSDGDPTPLGGISDKLAVSFNFCNLSEVGENGQNGVCSIALPGMTWPDQRAVALHEAPGSEPHTVSDVYVRFNDPVMGATVKLCSELIEAGDPAIACGLNALDHGIRIEDVAFAQGQAEVFIEQVPEPSTYVMVGTGFLGILGYAWRRRKLLS